VYVNKNVNWRINLNVVGAYRFDGREVESPNPKGRPNLTQCGKRFATASTSTQVAVLSWRYDAEMSTANSLHASAQYGEYNERFGFWCIYYADKNRTEYTRIGLSTNQCFLLMRFANPFHLLLLKKVVVFIALHWTRYN